jgi:hypothetical protein
MSQDHNEGIIMSGGNLTAKAVAVGRGASAQVSETSTAGGDLAKLQRLLGEFLRKLEEHGEASVSPGGEVKRAVESVQHELSQPKPSRLTVTALLGAVASSVQGVASLASIVETARQIVEKIF